MRTCKHCAAPLRVVDTRRASVDHRDMGLPATSTIWRRRECANGHRFDTIEVPIGPKLRYRVHTEWPKGGAK